MDRKLTTLIVIFLFLLYPIKSLADWYILLPADRRPGSTPEKREEEKKLNKQPYKTERKKIPSPKFQFKGINGFFALESLKGKKVMIFFFENPYSPTSEELIKKLDNLAVENTIILCVDINDADYSILKKYKTDMKIRNIYLTADSFLFKKFKDTLKIKKLPASIFIDKNGFIKFYSDRIDLESLDKFEEKTKNILEKM